MSRDQHGRSSFDGTGAQGCGGAGTLSRRDALRRGVALGIGAAIATPSNAPAGAASVFGTSRRQGDPTTLVVAANGSPSDLDPHSSYDYRSVLAILGSYEGLIGLKEDKTDEFEGLLAESWEANADLSVWTFHLRAGVTFHDGTPLDAAAVRASYERLLTLGLGPVEVFRRFVQDVAQVTTPDPQTVVFDLGRPQPLFTAAMASTYAVPIVNAKVMREHDEDDDWGHTWAQTNAVGTGTGPYKIVEFEPGQQLVMERFDGYWRGWEGDHFERIVIRTVLEVGTRRQLIEQGEADLVDSLTAEDSAALEQNPDLVVRRDADTQVNYFTMSVAGPLASTAARQAMCYAFPYADVLNGVYAGNGEQPVGPVARLCHGFNPQTFQYSTDLAKARELFAQAGLAEGTELTLTMESGVEVATAAAQLFQASLAEVGITLTIEQVDLTTFTALFYGDMPAEERSNLLWWGWWPDYNDAWNHLYPQISCEAWGSKGANAGFYCNDQAEALLTQAKEAPDEGSYLSALAELQQIVALDPPSIYYVQPKWLTVIRKDLAGFVFNPVNIGTYNFWRMSRVTT